MRYVRTEALNILYKKCTKKLRQWLLLYIMNSNDLKMKAIIMSKQNT